MSTNTNIEWTDATWNPVEGCTMAKGSETGGCLNCYAARNALRRPQSGLAVMRPSGPRWTGKVGLVDKRLTQPLHWREPRRIFVNSMSDLFHERLPDEAIDRVFAVMALCPQHTFQVLTKRPERMTSYLAERSVKDMPGFRHFEGAERRVFGRMVKMLSTIDPRYLNRLSDFLHKRYPHGDGFLRCWPLPNVWLGVSVEDQKTADARIPLLLQTPAAKRFVSYEPALGPVDFFSYLPCTHAVGGCQPCKELEVDKGLDWIIVGGESGPGARPFDIQWARQTIEQCRDARVACFVKQLGAKPYREGAHRQNDAHDGPGTHREKDFYRLKDCKGGTMSEWPEDLRVREFPR